MTLVSQFLMCKNELTNKFKIFPFLESNHHLLELKDKYLGCMVPDINEAKVLE